MKLIPFMAITTMVLTVSRMNSPQNMSVFPGGHTTGNMPDSSIKSGKALFEANCASCHKDSANYQAPGTSILGTMNANAVLAALDNGKMKAQAAGLSEEERKTIARWITRSEFRSTTIDSSYFTHFYLNPSRDPGKDFSGWGSNLRGTGFRNSAQAGITEKNVSTLRLKWAFAFPEATIVRSKPAIIGDWLIVGGQYGDVFAINQKTGLVGWHFAASAAIRGAISVVENGKQAIAYFADFSCQLYAVDVNTGKELWSKRAAIDAQSSVTGSVAVYNNKIYVPLSSVEVAVAANGQYRCCTASGGVMALDASNGNELWRHRIIERPATLQGKNKNGKPRFGPAGGPVWCSPTIDIKRSVLYIGTGENYSRPTTGTTDAIQALDLNTGKLKWNFQATADDAYNVACPVFANCPDNSGPDFDFGMAPLIVTTDRGKDLLLAGQKSGIVFAIDPDNGKMIWKKRIGKGGMLGGIHWGMSSDSKRLYVSNSDNVIAIDKRYDSVPANPGLFALDIVTGKQLWKGALPNCDSPKNCLPFYSAAPASIPGLVFAGSLDGHIRAFSSRNGQILWDFDTTIPIQSCNGVQGNGGAIDGPSAVAANGMLFVNSGYGMFGQKQGNLLLAFEIDNHTSAQTHNNDLFCLTAASIKN